MKRRAFTLAEVLITLGIIGVISMLTFPSLNASTRAQQNRATLKNTMSIISNVATMNIAKNEWGFEGLDGFCTTTVSDAKKLKAETDTTVCGLFNSMLTGEEMLPYADTNGVYANGKYSAPLRANMGFGTSAGYYVSYQLQNGAIISLPRGASNCKESNNINYNDYMDHTQCIGFIDVNGVKPPNKAIACADGTRKHIWDSSGESYISACMVEANDNSDIFPFRFYDNTVELASNAAKGYLNNNK